MKRFFFYMIMAVFMASRTDSGLDCIESADQQPSAIVVQSSVWADAEDRCRSFRPNHERSAKFRKLRGSVSTQVL